MMGFGAAPTTVPIAKPAVTVNGNAGTPQPVAPAGKYTPQQLAFFQTLHNRGVGQQPQAPGQQSWSPQQLAFFQAMHDRTQAQHGVASAPLALDSGSQISYQQGMNNANENLAGQLAQNAYGIQTTDQAYAPQFAQLQQNEAEYRTAEPGQFVGRGILGSGIQNEDLQQNAQHYLNAYGQLQQARSQALGGLQLQGQAEGNDYLTQLANLGVSKSQALGNLAKAQLTASRGASTPTPLSSKVTTIKTSKVAVPKKRKK